MAASKNDKQAYALLSEYIGLYRSKYGAAPVINKYKEKWGMLSLIEDFGVEDVGYTLEFYFKLSKDMHPLPWFYNNFSTIHNSRLATEKDDRIRSVAREQTQKLRAEYLNGVH